MIVHYHPSFYIGVYMLETMALIYIVACVVAYITCDAWCFVVLVLSGLLFWVWVVIDDYKH